MKKIGLLSDTHSYIDDELFEHFKDVDEIWHAGDVGAPEVLEKLIAFKPVKGVWGNIDGKDVRAMLPFINRFVCEEVNVMMTHIGGYPGKYIPKIKAELLKEPIDLFICGHSHILKVMYDKQYGFLHMNPGAYGKEGFHQVRTLLRFSITGKQIHNLEIIELKRR
ncbi:metallophosphoesterase family protein [Solitalea lacus]|uniref:metallophosphoesterase family protein n=1 Tax=Solitalea lacus TaxID=2911172 RepID=UPI001EDB5E95|nr:metallophosphoesterase family protein [Solitalea lacus]UKJ06007.1 metallophosphatase family protein [Solitalea lacus]